MRKKRRKKNGNTPNEVSFEYYFAKTNKNNDLYRVTFSIARKEKTTPSFVLEMPM